VARNESTAQTTFDLQVAELSISEAIGMKIENQYFDSVI
jgi:hypothetical protein